MKKEFEKTRNPPAPAPVDPPRRQPPDDALHEAVVEALAQDGRLEGETFEITVRGGTVQLNGTVTGEYIRGLVDTCISTVPGVLVVKNQLLVKARRPSAPRRTPEGHRMEKRRDSAHNPGGMTMANVDRR